jgi:hypothetical protein
MDKVTVDVADATPGQQRFTKTISIAADLWELNIWLTNDDIAALKARRPGSWADRKSLRSGTSAGASVFWSIDDGQLTIVVGEDDETWDFALTLPESTLTAVLEDL